MASKGWFARLVEAVEVAAKLGGGIVIVTAVLSALPVTDGTVKAITGWLYGVKGAIYYEVGPDSDAMYKTINEKDEEFTAGGLFLLRNGGRKFEDLRWGDVLQAGTDKNFRSLEGSVDANISDRPKIFVLSEGKCVVVISRIKKKEPEKGESGGWLKVATSACGLFR